MKFNDADDVICPPFVLGSIPVGSKTWWHQLIDSESSLTSTVQSLKLVTYHMSQYYVHRSHTHRSQISEMESQVIHAEVTDF